MSVLRVDRPVFIVGSASSGTTLLGVMLDRHAQFACGPEVYAFDKRQLYAPWPHVQRNIGRWLRRGLLSDGHFAIWSRNSPSITTPLRPSLKR